MVHHAVIGRDRRKGWLQLDGQRNVSGESGRGLVGLNVFSDLYVGGYDGYQMSGLPDELPFSRTLFKVSR